MEEYKLNGYDIKSNKDEIWVRVFFHNITTGDIFKTNEEANFTRKRSKNKFSVLKYINEKFKFLNETDLSTYYEFQLNYSEVNSNFHWIQETHPTEKVNKTGYKPINFEGGDFSGLGFSSGNSFLDGQTLYSGWWYSIGCKMHFEDKNAMPGPKQVYYIRVHDVSLWMRIKSFSLIQYLPLFLPRCTQIKRRRSPNFELFLFILLQRS